jgi:UDP-glucose 6-dehydrogenase
MKLFCNSFYATKIQFFTEIKMLCDNMNIEYNNVIKLMLNNGWINPMHTIIPGHDGELSFGGACLPKDINALGSLCNNMNSPCDVIQAVITENKKMRNLL